MARPPSTAASSRTTTHLYEAPNLPRGFAEAVLSAVEADAAPVIEKFVQSEPITDTEQAQLDLFVYVQQQRTPRGRGS